MSNLPPGAGLISQKLGYDFYARATAVQVSWESATAGGAYPAEPTLFQFIQVRAGFLQAAGISVFCTVHNTAMAGIYGAGSFFQRGVRRDEMWHFAKRSCFHAAVSGGCAVTNGVGVISPSRGASLFGSLDGFISKTAGSVRHFLSPVYEYGTVVQKVGAS